MYFLVELKVGNTFASVMRLNNLVWFIDNDDDDYNHNNNNHKDDDDDVDDDDDDDDDDYDDDDDDDRRFSLRSLYCFGVQYGP